MYCAAAVDFCGCCTIGNVFIFLYYQTSRKQGETRWEHRGCAEAWRRGPTLRAPHQQLSRLGTPSLRGTGDTAVHWGPFPFFRRCRPDCALQSRICSRQSCWRKDLLDWLLPRGADLLWGAEIPRIARSQFWHHRLPPDSIFILSPCVCLPFP